MTLMWSLNEEDRLALEASWLAFAIKHADMATISGWWREIDGHYAEPHRHYHTLGHVRDMLPYVSGEAVVAATWFHHIVYDPARTDNEEQSARLAAVALRQIGHSVLTIEFVMQMIRATATEHPGRLPRQALTFLDADLAILGSHHERYIAYRDAIRREYAFVPDDEFAELRRERLERFLMRPNIYYTEGMREQFERQARANLAWELSATGTSPTP